MATIATAIHAVTAQRVPFSLIDQCFPPAGAVTVPWAYDDEFPGEKLHCIDRHEKSGAPWIMLNAYRSGGRERFHWMYDDDKDPWRKCLTNWTYYMPDGVTVIAQITGTTTTINDKKGRPWCATSEYRPGGVRGYQLDYCQCLGNWPPSPPPHVSTTSPSSPVPTATKAPPAKTLPPRHTLGF